ncbi:hypothetical protein [Glutamicibacter creatinolyticus]|uniref:hypothetical protein n=1 Tax=Glutamicibacter creatinolyticus TaxID=162496 RepID=UPI00321627C3
MSDHVDIDQLVRDMGDASSEYVNIRHDDLMNLIERLRSANRYHAEMTAWLAEFPERLARPCEEV